MNYATDTLTQSSAQWLREFKQQQYAAFSARGYPHKREERWKYTDVSFLPQQTFHPAKAPAEKILGEAVKQQCLTEAVTIVLINGVFAPELSQLQMLPANVILCSLSEALQNHAEKIQTRLAQDTEKFPFASLNASMLEDGVFLAVPKNQQVTPLIHFLYINSSTTEFMSCPRNIVLADTNSHVTILEEHRAFTNTSYFTNVVTQIETQANAQVHYHKIQQESLQATHIAQIFIEQSQNSSVNLHSLTLGAKLAREEVWVNLAAAGSECCANGFYYVAADKQHIDNHVQVNHLAEHTHSDLAYKGIMDKQSRAVFNGKVYVAAAAQKTHSEQSNHNLLLSPTAEVNTKPELEIYADDVKCAHGATVGQLDTSALFYLRARGIDEATAMQLLTSAFATDIFQKITHAAVRQKMQNLFKEKLSHD